MNYLMQFGLSDMDIEEIEEQIDDFDYIEYTLKQDKVCDVINYFKSIGITNIKDLLIVKGYLFYEPLEELKSEIKIEMVPYINADVSYLDRVGI